MLCEYEIRANRWGHMQEQVEGHHFSRASSMMFIQFVVSEFVCWAGSWFFGVAAPVSEFTGRIRHRCQNVSHTCANWFVGLRKCQQVDGIVERPMDVSVDGTFS